MSQPNNDLLNNSDSAQDIQVKAAQNKEVLTEVTSIAKEEEKTGVKVATPSKDELVARAGSSMIVNMQRLNQLITKKANGSNKPAISRNAMNRILLAILSLPTEGVPVNLKSEEEKLCFAYGQRLIADRFILIQNSISEEIAKQREKEKQTAEQAETKTNEGESNGTN